MRSTIRMQICEDNNSETAMFAWRLQWCKDECRCHSIYVR